VFVKKWSLLCKNMSISIVGENVLTGGSIQQAFHIEGLSWGGTRNYCFKRFISPNTSFHKQTLEFMTFESEWIHDGDDILILSRAGANSNSWAKNQINKFKNDPGGSGSWGCGWARTPSLVSPCGGVLYTSWIIVCEAYLDYLRYEAQ